MVNAFLFNFGLLVILECYLLIRIVVWNPLPVSVRHHHNLCPHFLEIRNGATGGKARQSPYHRSKSAAWKGFGFPLRIRIPGKFFTGSIPVLHIPADPSAGVGSRWKGRFGRVSVLGTLTEWEVASSVDQKKTTDEK